MKKVFTLLLSLAIFQVGKSQVCAQFVDVSKSFCTAFSDTEDVTDLATQLCGDSITIVFNAAGTVLAGDTDVYFQSAPQFIPFAIWGASPYTINTRMDSIGVNLWSITINPRTYYGYPVDSCLNGIWFILRNSKEDTVINNGGNNYFVYTVPNPPTSTYANVTATDTNNTSVSYLWSDGDTDSVRIFTAGGNYSVTATGVGGCTAVGTVNIKAGIGPVSIGSSFVRCSTSPTTEHATADYATYAWVNGTPGTSDTFLEVNPGLYWVQATDSAGCVSSDTIEVRNSDVLNLSLPDTLGTCPGKSISIDASTNINLNGDSVVIIYNDSLGQTTLVGDTAVYMHSAPEFTPGAGWPGGDPFTDGDNDQSILPGKMTSVGHNLWRIAIDPYAYYHISGVDSTIIGIWLIFRNYANTQFGRDANGNNIFINLQNEPPTSTFNGITVYRTPTQPLHYNWSNSNTSSIDTFTIGGTYYVTVSDNNGCRNTDSVVVTFTGIKISLGNDTTVCKGQPVHITGPTGYVHYTWSANVAITADTTDSITATVPGIYTLSVVDTNGCNGSGSKTVLVSTKQVSLGPDIVNCVPNSVDTLNPGTGFAYFIWNDGNTTESPFYIVDKAGLYWVQAFDSFGCISNDTIQIHNSEVNYLSIPDSLTTCPGKTLYVDASTNINLHGDSIVIIYTDTLGNPNLAGDTNVYIRSAPQFTPFAPWGANDNAFIVGGDGDNDGIGRMTYLGNNQWRIAIDPYDYYHVSASDSTIIGIWMVFTNFNASAFGKDDNGNNIFVNLQTYPPSSTFAGVTASRTATQPINYSWSNGAKTAATSFTANGTYYVTASDTNGCSKIDSVVAVFENLTFSLGNDTSICNGRSVTITGPANERLYTWSRNNGIISPIDTTNTFIADSAGIYQLSFLDTSGCTETGSKTVSIDNTQVTLGNNVVRCNPNEPVTISTGGGTFTSYQWLGGAPTVNDTYVATTAGVYWVAATDNSGCISYDTLQIHNSEVNYLSIPDSEATCPGNTITVNASTNINLYGDSVVIIYNDSLGNTQLLGDTNVYMHSAPQFVPFAGWPANDPFTVGGDGTNDGIGRMTSIGHNLWRIAIDPYAYYHVSATDGTILGIWMVFDNYDAKLFGKDDAGGNIFVNLETYPPTSTFDGVTASRTAMLPIHYAWSNNDTTAIDSFTTSGIYYLTVSDNNGCSRTDTLTTYIGKLTINLGDDTTICKGTKLVIGTLGLIHYLWSNGDTTQTITVDSAGTYSLTAADSNGCQLAGSITVSIDNQQVSLGNNILQCTTAPVTLSASAGFVSYAWLNGTPSTAVTYDAIAPGPYWIAATDSFQCTSYDTITVHYSDVNGLNLPDTVHGCPGSFLTLNALTSVQQNGDSLVIIYNATDGQSGLVGATKVYFHSAPEFLPGQGWQVDFTVGDWGVDNGIGEMDSLGNNMWEIIIDPYDYYHMNPDTPLAGIFMVFRNANGSETGKDATGNNIFLDLSGAVPTSTFDGITAYRKVAGTINYSWSTGATTSSIQVDSSGTYIATATDNNGCSKADTVQVALTDSISVNLGPDTNICKGDTVLLNAGAGFATYSWSNGDSSQTIRVATAGTYSVTVTAGNCSANDSITVSIRNSQVAISGGNVTRCVDTPITLTASPGFVSYLWFSAGVSSQTRTAVNPGPYWVQATDSSGCISYDTVTVGNSDVQGLSLPDSVIVCQGDTAKTDASVSINAKGDSLVIIYDANVPVSGLAGATKVYFHSAPEFHPGQGWLGTYTVGDWGEDNGVGLMTSLGDDKWRIAINPYDYYHINPDTPLYAIFMVFRNADGTETGKSATNGNIEVDVTDSTAVSLFSGVTATHEAVSGLVYNWSNNVNGPIGEFTEGGFYTVTVSDLNGCSQTDSIFATVTSLPAVTLNISITCQLTSIYATPGYASYIWADGNGSDSLIVTTPGTYSVTVTNAAGCNTVDSATLTSVGTALMLPVLPDTQVCNGDTVILNAGPGFIHYSWQGTSDTTPTYAVTKAGTYYVLLTDSQGCQGTDSVVVTQCTQTCHPNALFFVQNVTPLNSVTLVDSTTNHGTYTYYWSFGDGVTDTTSDSLVVHTYGAAGLYKVILVVRDSCGSDTFSTGISVNYNGITSVPSLNEVKIYPNPASDVLNVELKATLPRANVLISIRNVIGQLLQTTTTGIGQGTSTMNIDISMLAEGIYTIEINTGQEKVVNKFVIAR